MTTIQEEVRNGSKWSAKLEIANPSEKSIKIETVISTSDDKTNSIETKEINSKQEISSLQKKKETGGILSLAKNFKKSGNSNLLENKEENKRNKIKKTQNPKNSKTDKESVLYKEILFYSKFLLKVDWESLDPNLNPGTIFSNSYFPKYLIYKDLSDFGKSLIERSSKKQSSSDLHKFIAFLINLNNGKEFKISQLKGCGESEDLLFLENDLYHTERRISDLLKKKNKCKKNGKTPLEDRIYFLKIRNKLTRLLKESSSKGGEKELRDGNPICSEADAITPAEPTVVDLDSLKSCPLSSVIDMLIRKNETGRNRIKEIFVKIEKKRNELKYEEDFFARDPNEDMSSAKTQSVFHSKIPQNDILYNLKTFFVLEEKFLETLENKAKLEKESNIANYFSENENSKVSQKHKLTHNDMICYICNNPDYHDKNQIVFCSTCNVSVHQNCYQLEKIPKNDWVCDLCMFFGPEGKMVECPLCPCKGGVLRKTHLKLDDAYLKKHNPAFFRHNSFEEFKKSCRVRERPYFTRTPESEIQLFYNAYTQMYNFSEAELKEQGFARHAWVHLSCVHWNPKLEFRDNMFKGFGKVAERDFSELCRICSKRNGLTVGCRVDECKYKFHVECARRAKLSISASNAFSHKNCIYCPEHTPLPLKKSILNENRRAKDDIKKYLKNLKRFLSTQEIKAEGFENKVELAEEPSEELEIEKLVEFFDVKKKRLFREIKEQLKQKVDWRFVIKLSECASGFTVTGIQKPSKFIFLNKIKENALLWKKIGTKWDISPRSLYLQFQSLQSEILFLHRNQKSFIVRKEIEGSMTEEYIPNTEGFGSEIHCLCQKEWKGEVMIQCDRCDLWFHPTCIGFRDENVKADFFYCLQCKENFENEYGALLHEQLDDEIEPENRVPIFKYTLRYDLNQILKENEKEIKKSLRKTVKEGFSGDALKKTVMRRRKELPATSSKLVEEKLALLIQDAEFEGIEYFFDEFEGRFDLKKFLN